MRAACEMQDPTPRYIADKTHEGERVEMHFEYATGLWRCSGCGYTLDPNEALYQLPYAYQGLDNLHWAMLDAEPLFVCRPQGVTVEYPRR